MTFRRGGPQPLRTRRSPVQRFWAMVEKSDECWLWKGQMAGRYGRFTLRDPSDDRTNVAAHRYAYELTMGQMPSHLTLDHLCRRPACVRPDHMQPVSAVENLRRSHEDRGHRVTVPTLPRKRF